MVDGREEFRRGRPGFVGMARRILGVLLAAMALGQLSDLSGFVDIVDTYGLGGRAVAIVVGGLLVVGELLAGVGLLGRSIHKRVSAAILALTVAVAWSVLAGQAFARGLSVPNCGCFGVRLGQPLRWWVLLEDVEFVALAWWVRRRAVAEVEAAAERWVVPAPAVRAP